MKIHLLEADLHFPPVSAAGEHGLLAVGGDLSPARLMAAYEHGTFPWFMEDEPIMWWAPPERAVLSAQGLKVTKSMRNILNRRPFRVTMDRCFEEVVRQCQKAPRDGEGTWITDDIVEQNATCPTAMAWTSWREGHARRYSVLIRRPFISEPCSGLGIRATKVSES